MKMDKKLRLLAGKEHEELENALGFTHYLETKGFENFKPVKEDHITNRGAEATLSR